METHLGRRLAVLAAAVALILAMSSVMSVAAARPAQSAHFVTGSYIVEIPDLSLRAIHRIEIQSDAVGRVVFGYYEQTTLTTQEASKAIVETVRFFTLPSGAAAAQFTGLECGAYQGSGSTCGEYHIIVSDGGSVGDADTFCGGPATDPDPANWPCYSWDVVSGNIAIY